MQRIFVWLVFGLSLSACASAERPSVSLASVKLAGVGLFEQRFVTILRIQNPSNAELTLDGISVEIELNGNALLRGVNPASVVIPAYAQDTVRVEATSTTSGVVRQLRALAKADAKVSYRLKGRLQPRERPAPITFDEKGVISLTDLGS